MRSAPWSRLVVASALLAGGLVAGCGSEPDPVLVDEPTTTVDPEVAARIMISDGIFDPGIDWRVEIEPDGPCVYGVVEEVELVEVCDGSVGSFAGPDRTVAFGAVTGDALQVSVDLGGPEPVMAETFVQEDVGRRFFITQVEGIAPNATPIP